MLMGIVGLMGFTDSPSSSLQGAEVGLVWRAVETDAVGYRVSWGPASGLYTGVQIVPWVYETNCTVTVPDGERQFFVVRAFGPGGESEASQELVRWPRLKLIVDGVDGVDGMDWRPLWTNEVVAERAWEIFRVRVERSTQR